MPYTQAYPLRKSVDDALKRKVDLLKKRATEGSDAATYYFTNRTPWIRMVSAVNVIGQEEQTHFKVTQASQLAQDYQLTSGYEQGDLPAGHSLSQELGVRPRPGIQNMSITSHNQFGSLRTAKVNFQVWSKEDLDACEVLYMRPGMSVLLEWGWSLYLTGEGDDIKVKQMERGYNIFNTQHTTLIGMLTELEQLKTTRGYGYDAIFGFVKNFNWKLRSDGGYDCSTDIVSPGELVESLSVTRPLADNDADLYEKYFEGIASDLDKKAEQADSGANSVPVYIVASSGGQGQGYKLSDEGYELRQIKKQLTKEALDFRESIVKFEEQNSIYTILAWDMLWTGARQLSQIFGEKADNEKGIFRLKFSDLDGNSAILAKRLYNKSQHQDTYQNLLQVNWVDPTYGVDANGEENKEEIVTAVNTQYYVKLGYMFELLNEFFINTGDRGLIQFDTLGRTFFNQTQEFMVSLDPSVCILASDFANMQLNTPLEESSPSIEDIEAWAPPQAPDPNAPITPTPLLPYEEKQEEPITDGVSILETYVNIQYLLSLLEDSDINTNTKSGVPVARMFSFIQSMLGGINASCAGLCELDIQYYEHEGLYGVIDRRNFYDGKEAPTFLNLLGLGSLFYSHDVSSALTPALASSIAISAQAQVSSTDSTAAGFLRFNHGLEDRVLKDRNLVSQVVNPEAEYTSTQEDKQRIRRLYSALYGALGWADESFKYARELYHQYINEHYVKNSDTFISRVVIPFVATFELDGMSGFRILNSFRVAESLLPYSYNYIKGGIGMIATGLEASVDSSKWSTRIKAQMYPLASGTLPVSSSITQNLTGEDEVDGNVIVEYSDAVVDVDVLKYLQGGFIESNYLSTYEDQKKVFSIVDYEYGRWGRGTRTEITDRGGLEVEIAPSPAFSNQMKYWDNLGWTFTEWVYAKKQKLNGEYEYIKNQTVPWSAAYISYIMNNGSTGLQDTTFKKASAHWQYAKVGLENRKAGKSYGGWVLFSLNHDASKYPIVAEVGDIILQPRSGGYYNSHGDVVFYIKPPNVTIVNPIIGEGSFENIKEGDEFETNATHAEALYAGGNLSSTNKIGTMELVMYEDNGVKKYCYPVNSNSSGPLAILKRF